MLDLKKVNWRQDGFTCDYIEKHKAELTDPSSMSPDSLAQTTTYCEDLTNPYAEELARRAGILGKYLSTSDVVCADVVRRAAKGFNIILI